MNISNLFFIIFFGKAEMSTYYIKYVNIIHVECQYKHCVDILKALCSYFRNTILTFSSKTLIWSFFFIFFDLINKNENYTWQIVDHTFSKILWP